MPEGVPMTVSLPLYKMIELVCLAALIQSWILSFVFSKTLSNSPLWGVRIVVDFLLQSASKHDDLFFLIKEVKFTKMSSSIALKEIKKIHSLPLDYI